MEDVTFYKNEKEEFKGYLSHNELNGICDNITKNTGYGFMVDDDSVHLFAGNSFSLIASGGYSIFTLPITAMCNVGECEYTPLEIKRDSDAIDFNICAVYSLIESMNKITKENKQSYSDVNYTIGEFERLIKYNDVETIFSLSLFLINEYPELVKGLSVVNSFYGFSFSDSEGDSNCTTLFSFEDIDKAIF